MMNMKVVTLFLTLIVSASCDVKTWQLNTNFGDPANWNGNGVFCANDMRVYPKAMKASIFIQQNQSLQELRMSDNMVLVIKEGASLSFGDQPVVTAGTPIDPSVVSCTDKGRELQFMAAADSWFNPDAWASKGFNKNDSQRFLLDFEKVPCEKDSVVFPPKNSFLVNMEGHDLKVASVTISGEKMDSPAAFRKYWTSNTATYEFHNSTSTSTVTGQADCSDDNIENCQCDVNTGGMFKKVCEYHGPCMNVSNFCAAPVSPVGQCCNLCGALVFLQSNDSSNSWGDLHQEISGLLTKAPDVQYAMTIRDNMVEITLKSGNGSDGDTGQYANAMSCVLLNHFRKNESLVKYNLYGPRNQRSDGIIGCPIPVPPTKKSRVLPADNNNYIIIGIVCAIALVIILVIILGIFLYKKRQHGNFKNEMELGEVPGRTVQGFDNPVYDVPLPFDDHLAISYDAHNEEGTGFSNPIYSPGADSGVSVSSSETEKKALGEGIKRSKKAKSKKPTDANIGFDNPTYSLKREPPPFEDDLKSVPLEEDDMTLSVGVKHDGMGFANPIATGLSDEAVNAGTTSTPPPMSPGFDNPLFESAHSPPKNGQDADVTVHTKPKNKKKNKGKKSKAAKKETIPEETGNGFDNPLYGDQIEDVSIYQPQTPGEDVPQMPDDSTGSGGSSME